MASTLRQPPHTHTKHNSHEKRLDRKRVKNLARSTGLQNSNSNNQRKHRQHHQHQHQQHLPPTTTRSCRSPPIGCLADQIKLYTKHTNHGRTRHTHNLDTLPCRATPTNHPTDQPYNQQTDQTSNRPTNQST